MERDATHYREVFEAGQCGRSLPNWFLFLVTGRITYSAVIPTKDRAERVVATVGCLLGQQRLPEEIIVVDASVEPLVLPQRIKEIARTREVGLRVERSRPSTSAQRNLGADLVASDVVLFVDDDVVLPADYMKYLLRRWEELGLESLSGIVGAYSDSVGDGSWLQRSIRRLLMLHYTNPGGSASRIRRSGKMEFVDRPPQETFIPSAGAGATVYRTALARRHRFDERFSGYALGEDHDFSRRVSKEGRILLVPEVGFEHRPAPAPDGRESSLMWHYRGRRENFFRLRHLDDSVLSRWAFWISVCAEGAEAALVSGRSRNLGPLRAYAWGVRQAVRDARAEREAGARRT